MYIWHFLYSQSRRNDDFFFPSPMAADASSRKTFIKWCTDQINKYGIDGIDIDWEYPASSDNQAGCNVVNEKDDTKNFLTMLQELREALDGASKEGGKKELTAAVHVRTFITPSGNMKDVSEFAKVFDRVNIMTYDINGAWNTTSGPNSPFNFEPGHGDADSFVSAIENWKEAGMPYEKICPGIPFYGRSTSKYDNSRIKSFYFQYSSCVSE